MILKECILIVLFLTAECQKYLCYHQKCKKKRKMVTSAVIKCSTNVLSTVKSEIYQGCATPFASMACHPGEKCTSYERVGLA